MGRLNTIRKAAHQITQLENGAKVVTAASNSSVAAVGLVSNAGSRSEAVSGSASINRSITLGALGSHPGVNVKSVLHRERVGVYGVTVPSNAGSVAAAEGLTAGGLGSNPNPRCPFTGSAMQDRNDYLKDCYFMWGYNVPGLESPKENLAFAVMAEVFG